MIWVAEKWGEPPAKEKPASGKKSVPATKPDPATIKERIPGFIGLPFP